MDQEIKLESGEVVVFRRPKVTFRHNGVVKTFTSDELLENKEALGELLELCYSGKTEVRLPDGKVETRLSSTFLVVRVEEPIAAKPKPEKKAKKEKETTAPADPSTSEKEEENDVQ